MNDKPRFETTDLVKLAILLVLVFIAAMLYMGQGKTEQTRTNEIDLQPVEQTETAQTVTDKEAILSTEIPEESFDETDVSGEQTGETSSSEEPDTGYTEQEFPELPPSTQELVVNSVEGKITTTDGIVVYYLSVDRMVWIPVVPVEYSENTGGAAPKQDVNGDWYLQGTTGEESYVWDADNLVWVPVDNLDEVVFLPAEPGENEDKETVEGETEPGDTTSSGEEQASTEEPSEEQGATDKSTSESSSGEQAPTEPGTSVEAVATPVVKKPGSYTLRYGEFVYCIARRFDLDPYAILRLNGLRINTVVRTGTTLKLPDEIGAFPGNRALRAHPGIYTVKSGDTIQSIACLYGDVTPEAIAAVNQLEPPYTLSAGRVLNIP